MIKLNKLGIAVVFSLLLSLAVFTTGAFAQSANQNVDHGQISVSARAAVINAVARGIVGNAQHAYGWGGGDGWGGGCGSGFGVGCGNGFGGGFDGGCGGGFGVGCGNGFGNFFRTTTRCSSTRICSSIRECRWSRWGRFCHSVRICRSIVVCRRCRTNVGFGGFDNNWAVKRSLKR